MDLTAVPIVKPDAVNFIFGQSHFIKTVEDIHEAFVGAVPGIRFGLAFCEASGKRLGCRLNQGSRTQAVATRATADRKFLARRS
jgi:adenosine/AMP kinase